MNKYPNLLGLRNTFVFEFIFVLAFALVVFALPYFVLAERNVSDTSSRKEHGKSVTVSPYVKSQPSRGKSLIPTVPFCEKGYIRVKGNDQFNTKDFCVMQYEAKCFFEKNRDKFGFKNLTTSSGYNDLAGPCLKKNGRIISSPHGKPIVNLTQASARDYCKSIGASLINNDQWMTIARQAEALPENWLFGQVNGSALKHGLSYGQLQDGNLEYVGGEFQRTLKLPNGEKIWDLSGNATEFVDNTCLKGIGPGLYRPTDFEVVWPVLEYDYERTSSGPYYNGLMHEYIHGGMYYGCSSSGNIFLRGGGVPSVNAGQQFSWPGAFSLNLGYSNDLHDISDVVSFRCVKTL